MHRKSMSDRKSNFYVCPTYYLLTNLELFIIPGHFTIILQVIHGTRWFVYKNKNKVRISETDRVDLL